MHFCSELFTDTFGAEKAGFLYPQYPFYDIYQNSRFADFVLENGARRVVIEVDDEASHNKNIIAQNKFYDHLLKQNSMVHLGWDVYRFAVRQMQQQPDTIKDELRVFLGNHPQFREIADYLPTQRGQVVGNLELKEHQKAALTALHEMRGRQETTAHRLDIQTAVEMGELVPVRCIRIHTNIDLTKVRFNSVKYNIRDLESKLYVPERNQLIVDTWLQYVKNKRTVVFCASVKHAEEIAVRFQNSNIPAIAVSGSMKSSERHEALAQFASGDMPILCACDLLNEGWDCPQTEVLFMARPTMSKVLYPQQLGRGMRLSEGKDSLMVFDFVDNASQYNMPLSLHRMFKLKDYRPGETVLGKAGQRQAEADLYARGERPDVLLDWPVDATDYEVVDIFNWQEEAAGMISQMEFVRRVDVQTETIERYVRGDYTDKETQRNILANPFKRFQDMQMIHHTKTLGLVQVEETVWKGLSNEEKVEIERVCGEKLDGYYGKFKP